MEVIKKLLMPLVVIFLTIFAILPLFHSGFYPMHDNEQIARLFDLDQAIRSLEIPPRIAPNLGFGYGYPFFNFYPPFAYYVGEVFHLLGFGFIVSTKLMLITGFLLSALFMYLFAKDFFGRIGGVVSSVAYTYASYRALDVYVRGAYAEFFSFVFLPLIFWSLHKLSRTNRLVYLLIGSLGIAGLILSHNLVTLMFAPFIVVWVTYLIFISKKRLRFLIFSAAAIILGFGLTSYFWLPSYVERSYTLINILTTELANYSLHFVCVYQLWDSMWGYGGSIPGCYDGISFEIGKVQIILSVVAFGLAALTIIKGKHKEKTVPILIFTFFLLACAFLMIKYAKPLWDVLTPLWYIQFPWRFLLIASFATAFLSGSVLSFIKNERIKIGIGVLIIIFLIASNMSRFIPQRFFNATDNYYTNMEMLRWETSSLAYEYVPNGIQTKKTSAGTTQVAISKDQIATSSSTVISGIIQTQEIKNLPQHKEFGVSVLKTGIFQINTYSFPG